MLAESGVLDVSDGCENARSMFFKSAATGRPVQIVHGCGRRYDCQCPVCAALWRKRNRSRFRKVMGAWDPPSIRMLTLTLRKDWKDQTLQKRIFDLWSYRKELFRYLREELHFWIGGWCAAVELPNHIHIVMESDYIPQDLISAKWEEITGNSYYVWINQWDNIRDPKAFAISYITKYISKLGKINYYDALLLKGFHLVHSQKRPCPRPERKIVKEDREKWIKIDQLEFEALFLDFYNSIPDIGVFAPPPPDIWERCGLKLL